MSLFRFCTARGWRQVCGRYVPCLTGRDVEARREWAERHLDYAWVGSENLRYPHVKKDWKVARIDIDEKWFHMRTRKKETPPWAEQNKSSCEVSPSVSSTRSWVFVPSDGCKETSKVFLEYIGALKRSGQNGIVSFMQLATSPSSLTPRHAMT